MSGPPYTLGITSNRATYESPFTVGLYRLQSGLQRSEKAILSLIRDELRDADMLDIGVGGGRTTAHFAPLVRSYIGVDFSEAMIRACRKRFPALPFEVADVRALPFADSTFDFILFSFNGLDYVPADDRMRALREIRRVGRSSGRFCFSAHNLLWLGRRSLRPWLIRRINAPDVLERDAAVVQDGALLFGLSTYYVRPAAQIAQLREAGFGDVQIFGAAEGPYLHYLCTMMESFTIDTMSTRPVVPITPAAEPALVPSRPPAAEIVSWVMLALLILFILIQHLVATTIVGLTLFVILDRVSERLQGRMKRGVVRPLALLVVTTMTAAIIAIAIAVTATMLRRGASTIPDMMNQMAEILGSVRLWLGGLGRQFIPEVMTDAEDLKATIALWLKSHAQTLRAGGVYLGVGLLHMVMGSLLAILVFFRHLTHHDDTTRGPLARYLVEKVDRFTRSFVQVATAQIKISAVNTTLTGLYLLVILPLFGIQIPFGTTLVLITFICGLIPVVGNLISNTVITILSLGVSFGTAVASLSFLVVIHKLEYLINSRIVGGETDSQAWEILLAILIGEAAFGIGGVVMAPIVYAFIKRELRARTLV